MYSNGICAFIGHRQIPSAAEENVRNAAEAFLLETERAVFLTGGMGAFDTAASRAVRSLKMQYPRREISLRLILPSMRYVPKPEYMFLYEDLYDEILVCEASDGAHFKAMIGIRNRWMIDQADLVIAYVRYDYGGAYQALNYAKRQGKRILLL